MTGSLARSLAPFSQSRLLPRAAYLDDAVLGWEREHLFGGWVCVGRSSKVTPGGLAAESVGECGVLLTPDREGVPRGFENACRHRGHELAHRRHFVGRGCGRLPE